MKKLIAFILVALMLLSTVSCSKSTDIAGSSSDGVLHAFSVSESKQVYFAPGNLQYCPKTDTWRFAENAYDTIGEDNTKISPDYEGWLDLFAWGANGLSGIDPYCINEDNTFYGDGHNDIAKTKWDFSEAYNAREGTGWRMFTHDEIHYILMFRENAQKLFGYGTIDGKKGLFILPDDWQCPEGIDFVPSVDMGFENQYDWYYSNGEKENYNYNNFTKSDWIIISEAGGVFLPATGMRWGTECNHIGISGHYWTSSYYGEEFANCLCLFEHDLFLEGNFERNNGLGVRFVKDVSDN